MSDEIELNPELTGEQTAIENALRSLGKVTLPETAIDHDSVMYRAGWAAALAERDAVAERDAATPTLKATSSRLWPAIAATFAATTAACLLVIFTPPQTDDASMATLGTNSGQISPEESIKNRSAANNDGQKNIGSVAESQNKRATIASVDSPFSLARIITSPIEDMIAKRNAEFEKSFAELTSPTHHFPARDFISDSDDNWNFEPLRVLTPRSTFSFPLL